MDWDYLVLFRNLIKQLSLVKLYTIIVHKTSLRSKPLYPINLLIHDIIKAESDGLSSKLNQTKNLSGKDEWLWGHGTNMSIVSSRGTDYKYQKTGETPFQQCVEAYVYKTQTGTSLEYNTQNKNFNQAFGQLMLGSGRHRRNGPKWNIHFMNFRKPYIVGCWEPTRRILSYTFFVRNSLLWWYGIQAISSEI